VPDADDTAGALLALSAIARWATQEKLTEIRQSVRQGMEWLLQLQNRDGGWPTFCRGWGALPFDRSGVDLTAHALRALHAWRSEGDWRVDQALARGLAYLGSAQRPDGAWIPLWFGNQYDPAEENPVYGTSRVLLAYRDLGLMSDPAARRAIDWLAAQQRADGGWGPAHGGTRPDGVSSVEETAVAVEALLAGSIHGQAETSAQKGLGWLLQAVESDKYRIPSPIGFYFARLWYHERLYPLVFTVSALARGLAR
jgi:squalene-hopene/tetraprenyl-beta-curcumene cyclase